MTTRHHMTHADKVYVGDAAYQNYMKTHDRRGVEVFHLCAVDFGAVTTLDADGICVDATATGAATLSATGALVSGSVATFDVARSVSVTSTGNESGISFTHTGTDDYGETLVETVTGPNATVANTLKAFKTVVSTAVDGALTTTGGVTVGSADIFGLPFSVGDKGKVFGVYADGVPETTLTVVAADATVATATTGDVRGTVTPNTASDGTVEFSALVYMPDHSTKTAAFGVDQYGG